MKSYLSGILFLVVLQLVACGDRVVGWPVVDETIPTVTSTVPADGASDVNVNTILAASFSEEMDPATISSSTFLLMKGTTSVVGTVSYVGVTAMFEPSGALEPGTQYEATIKAGVKDLDGSSLAEDYVWTFNTGTAEDTTAPMVSATTPKNGAIEVAFNALVTATFSEAMAQGTITTATFTLMAGTVPVPGAVTYLGVTATFDPSANLEPETVYTATITTAATDQAGNSLAQDYVWTFTTGIAPDATVPMVSATTPANNATAVAFNAPITATFTEEMAAATISVATFTLKAGTTPIPGTVMYFGRTAIFAPMEVLAPETLFTATIKAGVEDLAGNKLLADYVWTFTTGTEPDTTEPLVTSTMPANGAEEVAFNTLVTATFSEAMAQGTITTATFTLKAGTVPVPGAVTYLGVTATFDPTANLEPETVYTVTIKAAATDLAGNSLAQDYVWTFTTGIAPDTTVPMVSATTPANNAAAVAFNAPITATFTEEMAASTISVATFTVMAGTTPIPGTVMYFGRTAIFAPMEVLAAETLFTATIKAGVKDLAGNALVSDYVWTFTTGIAPDTTEPLVTSTMPANGAEDVAFNTLVTATFSEAMAQGTITTATFTLKAGTVPVPGSVTYLGVTATFDPTANLEPETVYTATIKAAATDLAGNSLAQDYVWTFTTGIAPDTTVPMVSATTPANNAAAVAFNAPITATFTEEMAASTISVATFTVMAGTTPIPGTVMYFGRTAIFAPMEILAAETLFTATIKAGVKDLAGNGLVSDYVWTFTTGIAPDTTAPLVTSTMPANGAEEVAFNTLVTATFSEAMAQGTITTATFTLKAGTVPVPGSVTYLGVTATFDPTANLEPETVYTATIKTAATDLAGNALAQDYVWTFTTGIAPDTTVPMVSATTPANNAVAVAFNAPITATFTEEMAASTISVATFTVMAGTTPIPGTVMYFGRTAIFAPMEILAAETLFTATIKAGVKDLAGNGLVSDYVWTFTTGIAPDTTAPLVTSTMPANGAEDVAFNALVTATFSEAMAQGTITTATFTLKAGTVPVPGSVTYLGVTATFDPTANLEPETVYTATITTAATDLAGNALAQDYVWTFTTGIAPDTTAPMVSATTPANNATAVAFNAPITATFTEEMAASTISVATFTLMAGTTPIPGTVMYFGRTAIFAPMEILAAETLFTATIKAGVKDLAGNGLVSDYVWTFTTGIAPDTTAPLVTSTMPANGAEDVAFNALVTATFSEAMAQGTITTATFTLKAGTVPVPGSVTYLGVTATFDPTANLEPETVYTATITTAATDLAGNALAQDYVWIFTTGVAPDTMRPTVTGTVPDDQAVAVALNAILTATFSEAMAPASISGATFQLMDGTTPVPGTVDYLGLSATFHPDEDLAPDTLYTATIMAEVADLAGNEMLEDYVWTFTTGPVPDTERPSVTLTVPADDEEDVSVTADILAVFSEMMDDATLSTSSFTVQQLGVQILGTVTYDNLTATFNPTVPLAEFTTYSATVTTEATDLAGNSLLNNYVWNFTTGANPDITLPMVISTIPENLETEVELDTVISAIFSEDMDLLTINPLTFLVTGPGLTLVNGTVLYDVLTMTGTFIPDNDLLPETMYTATITIGAMDLAANGLLEDYVWTFTTGEIPDTTLPMVISTIPEDLEDEVVLDSEVSATFSEDMDPLTITALSFLVTGPGLTEVIGEVLYDELTQTATFTPEDFLLASTLYTVTITTDAADPTGNGLMEDYVWTFTTGEDPTITSTDPEDQEIDVALNSEVSATFSEDMDPLTITTLSFLVTGPGLTEVMGTVLYDELTMTATFTPDSELMPDTLYTAMVTSDATDLTGNELVPGMVPNPWEFTTAADPGPVIVIDMGLAETYAIAATAGVTNTITAPITHINGDVVLDPLDQCNQVTVDNAGGFGLCNGMAPTINGTVITNTYPNTTLSGFVKIDLNAAFLSITPPAGPPAVGTLPGGILIAAPTTLGAITGSASVLGDNYFTPGVYISGTSILISDDIELDGLGDPNAVFVFQSASTLTTADGAPSPGAHTRILLTGGTKASNVWWQVGSSATLGLYTDFKGNVLAAYDITMNTGATSCGRLMAGAWVGGDGAFVFDSNIVSVPGNGCPE